MDNSRDEILAYLRDTQSHWAAYHNHKETSAWAGVVLYIPLLALFLNIAGNTTVNTISLRIVATVIFLLTWLAVFGYLRQQFALRKRSADYVAACFSLRAKIISKPNDKIDPESYSLPKQGNKQMQSSHFLAEAMLKEADEMARRGQGARQALEMTAYGITVLALSLALARIWIV